MTEGAGLLSGKLSTWNIVFLVFATMTPLVALSSTTGLALGMGGGIGIVGLYVVVAACMLLFQFGYSAMTAEITNAGAFYAYITKGFGPTPGLAAALLSTLMYQMISVVIAAFFAFYARTTIEAQVGVTIDWRLLAVAAALGTFVLGRRNVDVSSKLLGIAVALETLLTALFVLAVIRQAGPGAFSWSVFRPSNIFNDHFGISAMMVIYVFGGIEVNAIYSEEARDPRRTARRAGLLTPLLLMVFYVVGAWALVTALGTTDAQRIAQENLGTVFFLMNSRYVGAWSTDLIQWLILFSLFAALLGTHNNASRYLFALGRDHILPQSLRKIDPVSNVPRNAGGAQIGCLLIMLGFFMVIGADPMVDIVTGFGGVIVLINVVLWAWVSAAAYRYFRSRRDITLWVGRIAPALSTVVFSGFAASILFFYRQIVDPRSIYIFMPAVIPLVVLSGVAYGAFLRRYEPDIFAGLGRSPGN